MSGQLSVERIKELINQLFDAIAQRVDAEFGLRERLDQENAAEQQRFEAASATRTQRFEAEQSAIQSEYDEVCATAGRDYHAHYSAASEEYDEALRAANSEYEKSTAETQKEFEETRWMVVSYFDETAGGTPKQQFEQFEYNASMTQQHLDTTWIELTEIKSAVEKLLQKSRLWSDVPAPRPAPVDAATSLDGLVENFGQIAESVRGLQARVRKKSLPVLFSGLIPVAVFFLALASLTTVLYFVVDPSWFRVNARTAAPAWWGILGGVSAVVVLTVQGILFSIARADAEREIETLLQYYVDADSVRSQWTRVTQRELKRRRKEYDDWYAQLVKERDTALQRAQDKYDRLSTEYADRRAQQLKSANERYPKLMKSITDDRDRRLATARSEYPERLNKLEARYRWDIDRLQKEHEHNLESIRQRFEFDWQTMAQNWLSAVDAVHASVARLQVGAARISQPWRDVAFGNWRPADQIPPALCLGQYHFALDDIEYGLPEDDRLVPEQINFQVPTLLNFPSQTSLLLRANGSAGRTAAVVLLQVAMLRLLTTLPPGKIRFTIIDPVGLGQDFSAFMHLVDYDELLVTKRIWTETSHIEQRLTDLTEHMETVFQTYLRNEFKTIEEYNEFAGEVAEPYQILVIAGFPANFTEQSARRLTSIVSSGPRCGVYTLLSVDSDLTMPPNFNLDDVSAGATCLRWDGERFLFEDEELQWLPFALEALPEPDVYGRIVKNVGDASKDARRVEVSFDRVAPRSLWQNDSRSGIDVPLGRVGATKLQHMRLGKGTSQHVLVAGKTGSGKSTFMHILITNMALHYSPDEIEFFLIDFKKGVEFKTYAAHRLPHARVIAIESDREFGLSVLERLDSILKERGDLFRERGVQDIASFRNENPEVRMPRILLLVDEFQEFFVEDDRLSQTSALLLDRLVRQGRAFGIHVLLGSQTLGGAYSLARSTLGQVAVRIALQCSETDAHLILSEDNTAARLLTRPGEAIYNDANGLLEGNHPFQIAWLDDDRRDSFLERITELTDEREIAAEAPIVFEGNVPADALTNRSLVSCFTSERPSESPRVINAWLGEAVAIKPHTAIQFRRISGSNLLIVGQSPAGARGILSTVVLAAAAQVPPMLPAQAIVLNEPAPAESPDDAQPASPPAADALESMKSFSFANFKIPAPAPALAPTEETAATPEDNSAAAQIYILDGEAIGPIADTFWEQVTADLPHKVLMGAPADAPRIMNELSATIRHRNPGQWEPPIFLVIDNLGRFRDLRKSDDDYSFASAGKQATGPSKQFIEILKDGPAVGVHTLIWCDTFNNVGRWMTGQTLRELEMRVAFQMSATDSSNLIDSPAAGRLGTNRALLFLEEHGSLEKFRPYGLPSPEFIGLVRRRYPHLEIAEERAPEQLEVCDDLSSFTIL